MIKKVAEDIDSMKFNTAVSSMMEFVNAWSRSEDQGSSIKSGQASNEGLEAKDLHKFLVILSPFAPHLTEELWHIAGFKGLCSQQKWPKYDEKLVKKEKVLLVIQINGKVRDKIEMKSGASQKEVERSMLKLDKIRDLMGKKKIKKLIFIPDKLINIVIG